MKNGARQEHKRQNVLQKKARSQREKNKLGDSKKTLSRNFFKRGTLESMLQTTTNKILVQITLFTHCFKIIVTFGLNLRGIEALFKSGMGLLRDN